MRHTACHILHRDRLPLSHTMEFDISATGSIWGRRGWAEMDSLREKLEDIKELRDLVRSLGRGGGWGPLRRAPVQRLDMRGRPGLLRTTLEAQETRGLTRSDDISRLLPSEVILERISIGIIDAWLWSMRGLGCFCEVLRNVAHEDMQAARFPVNFSHVFFFSQKHAYPLNRQNVRIHSVTFPF